MDVCEQLMCEFRLIYPTISTNFGKETKIGQWPVTFYAILTEDEFLSQGESRADLKCERKEHSVSGK